MLDDEPTGPSPADGGQRPRFRLAFTGGATPGKWARVWERRFPDVPIDLVPLESAEGLAAVRSGAADAALVRLPFDREGLHAIPLYTEATVVVMPKDHVLTLLDAVTPADLAEEIVHHPLDDVLTWPAPPGVPSVQRPAATADAVDLVLAGVGLVAMPQSLARLHHRKGLVHRPLEDPADSGAAPHGTAPVARSQMALTWREDRSNEFMDEFIGIVRGRTARSSRGTGGGALRGPAATPDSSGRTGGRGGSAGGGDGSRGRRAGRGGRSRPRGGGPSGRPRRGRPRGRR